MTEYKQQDITAQRTNVSNDKLLYSIGKRIRIPTSKQHTQHIHQSEVTHVDKPIKQASNVFEQRYNQAVLTTDHHYAHRHHQHHKLDNNQTTMPHKPVQPKYTQNINSYSKQQQQQPQPQRTSIEPNTTTLSTDDLDLSILKLKHLPVIQAPITKQHKTIPLNVDNDVMYNKWNKTLKQDNQGHSIGLIDKAIQQEELNKQPINTKGSQITDRTVDNHILHNNLQQHKRIIDTAVSKQGINYNEAQIINEKQHNINVNKNIIYNNNTIHTNEVDTHNTIQTTKPEFYTHKNNAIFDSSLDSKLNNTALTQIDIQNNDETTFATEITHNSIEHDEVFEHAVEYNIVIDKQIELYVSSRIV